jgi:flagellar biosynthesis GTPase FlhF
MRTIKCRECLLSSCCGRLYKNELKNKQIAWGKLTKSFECDYVLMESMIRDYTRSFLIHKKHPLYNGVAFGTYSRQHLTLSKFKQYLLDNPNTDILDHDGGISTKYLTCKRENLTTYVMLTNEHNEISIMDKYKLRPVHFNYFIIQNLSSTEVEEIRERERKEEKEKQYLERERLRKKEEREEEERRQYLEEDAERWRQRDAKQREYDKKKLLQKQNDDKEWQLLQKQKQEKKEKQYLERERVRKNLQNNSIKKTCIPKRLNKKIATSNKYNDEKDEDEFQAKMNRLIGDVKCAFTEPTSDDDSVNSLES